VPASLYTTFGAPDASFVAKHRAKLQPDAWRGVLADLVRLKGDAPIRTQEIEDALRAAGLAEGTFSPEDYCRISKLAARLTFGMGLGDLTIDEALAPTREICRPGSDSRSGLFLNFVDEDEKACRSCGVENRPAGAFFSHLSPPPADTRARNLLSIFCYCRVPPAD
jgi:hypothetical protein